MLLANMHNRIEYNLRQVDNCRAYGPHKVTPERQSNKTRSSEERS